MPLTDVQVRAARATDKPQKISDAKGLFLLVHPNGSKYWRLKYRYAGKEKQLALGVYPEVTLAQARAKSRDHAGAGLEPRWKLCRVHEHEFLRWTGHRDVQVTGACGDLRWLSHHHDVKLEALGLSRVDDRHLGVREQFPQVCESRVVSDDGHKPAPARVKNGLRLASDFGRAIRDARVGHHLERVVDLASRAELAYR